MREHERNLMFIPILLRIIRILLVRTVQMWLHIHCTFIWFGDSKLIIV